MTCPDCGQTGRHRQSCPRFLYHYDTAENFHPYECDGPGKCIHCDRLQRTSLMTGDVLHDPATCALCDPDYDLQPNPHWATA